MFPHDGAPQVLRQVVPIGVELDVPGEYQVFLLALYLWDDHFDVSYATTQPRGPRRSAMEMLDDWTATDDRGRKYRARAGGGGGGELQLMRRTFVPAVAADATSLTLTLTDWDLPLLHHVVLLAGSTSES